jgi:hypothetical protein
MYTIMLHFFISREEWRILIAGPSVSYDLNHSSSMVKKLVDCV